MNYEEKYKKALERAREVIKNNPDFVRVTPQLMEEIFPELKESEEEMVGMGGLGKVWKEQAIISRLDRIIELLERPIIMPFSQPIQPLQPIYYDTNKVYCDTANTEGGDE